MSFFRSLAMRRILYAIFLLAAAGKLIALTYH
jgi:hypothetical protein